MKWVKLSQSDLGKTLRFYWVILNRPLQHIDSLTEKALALRDEYESMGAELMRALFPQIKELRVSRIRLLELGLPAEPPDTNAVMWECIAEELEKDDDAEVEPLIHDDVRSDQMKFIKLAEESRVQNSTLIQKDVEVIRNLAIQSGLASQDDVDSVIYNMQVQDFLKLTEGFPKLSRVHFC